MLKKEPGILTGFIKYFKNPVMVSSLIIIISAPIGLFLLRVGGFRPVTQTLTAFETIIFNLCWIPPIVGKLSEKKS